jgi:single-stranded DNA-binding protein
MRTVNRITLLGLVSTQPRLEHARNGAKVVHFQLTTYRHGSNEGSDAHRCTVWNRLAEFVAANVQMGDPLYVEGRIEITGRDVHGVRVRSTDVIVRELIRLDAAGMIDDELEPQGAANG